MSKDDVDREDVDKKRHTHTHWNVSQQLKMEFYYSKQRGWIYRVLYLVKEVRQKDKHSPDGKPSSEYRWNMGKPRKIPFKNFISII